MRSDVLERLGRIARGEIISVPGGTGGTPGTPRALPSSAPGTLATIPARKGPPFQVFQVFQAEHDELAVAVAERAAIASVDGRVPPAYADAWAVLQTRKPGHVSEANWLRAVNDTGRFLDEWAALAFDFGWRSDDIFGREGLSWFCNGEHVRALGPDNAITASGRIFERPWRGGA